MNSKPHYGIQCPRCFDIIFSESTHHTKYCKCGACMIDGGTDYLRYSWANDMSKKDVILVPKDNVNGSN